jgi:hypothetical protein
MDAALQNKQRSSSRSSIPHEGVTAPSAPTLFDLIDCARAIERETGMKWIDALRHRGYGVGLHTVLFFTLKENSHKPEK